LTPILAMRNLLLISVLVVSCTYNNIQPKPSLPPQISQPLLVGSWKMVTNKGVDVSFDIVESYGKSWTQNTILGYNGKTTFYDDDGGFDPITKPTLKSPAGSIALQLWASPFIYSDVGDAIYFYSLQPNSTYTQLTGKLGYASVYGLSSNSLPPLLDTINFKSPIVINKIK
jgi:hypothetical protein